MGRDHGEVSSVSEKGQGKEVEVKVEKGEGVGYARTYILNTGSAAGNHYLRTCPTSGLARDI